MSSSATVLARVDVCRARVGRAGRAISLLVVVFASVLLLAFLERVDLHTVIICARSISSRHSRIRYKVSGRVAPLQPSFTRAALQSSLCTLTASANAVPEALAQSPTSNSLIQNLQRCHTRVSQAS